MKNVKESLSGDCHHRQDEEVHHRLGNLGNEMEMFINEEVIGKKWLVARMLSKNFKTKLMVAFIAFLILPSMIVGLCRL